MESHKKIARIYKMGKWDGLNGSKIKKAIKEMFLQKNWPFQCETHQIKMKHIRTYLRTCPDYFDFSDGFFREESGEVFFQHNGDEVRCS